MRPLIARPLSDSFFKPSTLAVCVLSLLFELSAVADNPDEWEQSVRDSNASSIVFISVTATRHNDLVDPVTGTGFIVHPDGYVLTCNHVVPKKEPDYKSVEATGSVGSRYEHPFPLQVFLRDEQLDLVLLKLPQRATPWRRIKTTAQGKGGSRIVALGFPLNENLLSVPGSITGTDGKGGRWLTDAAINRGMSGGPVFDRSGAIVAVSAAGYEEVRGLNFIIPIIFAKGLLERIGPWPLQDASDRDFEKRRAHALLLGYDGAFALAHALQGESVTQEQARLAEYIRQLDLHDVYFPKNPAGDLKDAAPASIFAQKVTGMLEARDFRLRSAFLVGWLGVITINTPSLMPEGFNLRKIAGEAGFLEHPEMADAEYLEFLVREARSQITYKPSTQSQTSPGQARQARQQSSAESPGPKPCRHPAHGVEKWNGENQWAADSGWRGGGSSPGEYCGAQLLTRQQKYPERKIELVDSGEEHKSEYTPFKHDYYKYKCSFREYWDPVYKLAISEHCR